MLRIRKAPLSIVLMLAMIVAVSLTSVALAGEESVWTAHQTLGEFELDAVYTEVLEDGFVDQVLEVHLGEITPRTRVDILLNGHKIGRMRTDDEGEGRFILRRLGVEADKDGPPIGPHLDEGDIIIVKRNRLGLSATFEKIESIISRPCGTE